MNIAQFSVRRPVFSAMVTLIIVVLGVMALSKLKVDLLPAIELPTLTVRTQYEGANPEVMETLVTRIVEEIVATVPGVEELTSSSYEGQSSVKVSFGWGTSIDTAAVDVRATLEDEISELPDEVIGPRVSKFDIDTYPVVILGISSTLDPVEMTRILENQIRNRFARIPGVAQIDPWGGFNREVRVEIDPEKINALNLSLEDILDALRNANMDKAAGRIKQGKYEVILRTQAEFNSLQQIADTMVLRHQGALVRLGQIATIVDSYEKKRRIIRVNGNPGLRVAIRKQPEANTVEVAERVLAEVKNIARDFPQINIVAVKNQGNFIQRSIDNVSRTIVYGSLLAILVLLLFLKSFRSTLVIAVSIPISIIATFALLYFSGFTLNLMTLGGLALGVGMMVDSSVVVLENIFRRYQQHQESPLQAAVKGTGEVSSAITAGTLTTMVIFLPLIFVEGVSGELFTELAYVVMFSLLCALLVALGLLPVLAAKLMHQSPDNNVHTAHAADKQVAKADRMANMSNAYHDLLRFGLQHRLLILFLVFSLLAGSLFLVPYIGSEFLPPGDEGEVKVSAELEVGTHLDLIDKQARQLEKLIQPMVPEAVSSVTSVMTSGIRGSSKARININLTLVPVNQRQRSNKAIANALRKQLDGKIAGLKIRVRAPQGQFLLERILASSEGIAVEVRGFDLETLKLISKQVAAEIKTIAGITDVESSRDNGVPQQEIRINRARANDLGVSVKDILTLINTAIAGSKAGEYRVLGNSYRILVQLKDAENLSMDDILNLMIATEEGDHIVLRHLLDVESSSGPAAIKRKDSQRIISVMANVSGRDPGSVAADIQTKLEHIVRPPEVDLLIAGDYEQQQESFQQLLLSLLLGLLLVYMVLAAQYESLLDPLIVMFSVPLAAIGVILTLFITETTLNLQSAIGCIMLGGIVVNNAILLVDQTTRLKRSGLDDITALAEAGRRRLRPILMTSLTTILALLPLALGMGEGADTQAPLARVVIGGLTASTLITLIIIPVVYHLMHAGIKSKPLS